MTLRLNGSTSGYTEIDAPAVAGSNTLVLPGGNGSSQQVLATNGSGALSWSNRPILQVVQVIKTDGFSSTSQNSFTDVTGLSATITPAVSSNKVLVLVNVNCAATTGGMFVAGQLVRGATAIGIGDVLSSSTRISFMIQQTLSINDSNDCEGGGRSFIYLDSPASTSATTYKLQVTNINSTIAGTWYVNRTLNTGANYNFSACSSITLLEVAA